eukprot:gnl/TRDRNA2_/TRDRNA2_154998_c0_seq1.p1 gnl/TRDRNA2_/TRDRNA2_154998_c0~~gnl/TRDRNA2_/TRDRNA2_154998_c0_seq1.p1  ORF type:complete len:155 (-),score=21.11 gnl/TRDRNA2_/TRDRNA2_154998_c0_seq1:123-524(-)
MLDANLSEDWTEVLSHTQRHLLCLARGFITNAEMMCIHKPTCSFGEATAQSVLAMLRKYVEQRGVEQDMSTFNLRRLRTCIITSKNLEELSVADSVFMVSEYGLQKVTDVSKLTHHHLCHGFNREEAQAFSAQ